MRRSTHSSARRAIPGAKEIGVMFGKKHQPSVNYRNPQNGGLEDDFPVQRGVIFRFYVSFSGCI